MGNREMLEALIVAVQRYDEVRAEQKSAIAAAYEKEIERLRDAILSRMVGA